MKRRTVWGYATAAAFQMEKAVSAGYKSSDIAPEEMKAILRLARATHDLKERLNKKARRRRR